MSADLTELEKRMHSAMDALKKEVGGLRTGRASVNLLDPVMVEAYGQRMPLNQVGTVSAPEPRLLTVSVWDKGLVTPTAKAIREAGLGLGVAQRRRRQAHHRLLGVGRGVCLRVCAVCWCVVGRAKKARTRVPLWRPHHTHAHHCPRSHTSSTPSPRSVAW